MLVPGNSESLEELQSACQDWPSAAVLHGSGTQFRDIPIWGLGGAVPVMPFGAWSYDLTEAEAAEFLHACPVGGILVTHSPPRGCLDVSSREQSLGSTAVLETVRRCRPKLVVCGHIHDSSGQQMQLGVTTIVNAAPSGVIFDFGDS